MLRGDPDALEEPSWARRFPPGVQRSCPAGLVPFGKDILIEPISHIEDSRVCGEQGSRGTRDAGDRGCVVAGIR